MDDKQKKSKIGNILTNLRKRKLIENEIAASVCEMPYTSEEFLTFGEKYLNGEKHQASMEALSRRIPAPIPDEMTKRIQDMTKEIFRLLDCKGVVRIDYICTSDLSELYVNEINTIPGSFAFYLWEPLGIPYPQLIDKLIEIAISASEEKKHNNFAFDSEIVAKFAKGSQKSGKSDNAKHADDEKPEEPKNAQPPTTATN